MARHAEDAGFDSIWVNDHLLFDLGDPVKPRYGGWESWSLLCSLAAVTARAEIGTFVTCTAFRNPALLAKMADTVEEVSGGRLILGLGAGYHELEFRSFGFPFDHLMGRFEEAVQIIHGLLRHGTIDFKGRFHEARDCELRPRGPRPNGPPLMIGARADRPRALRLAARAADYWNIFAFNRAEETNEARAAVDAACVAAGRDPATLRKTVGVLIDLPGVPSEGLSAGFSAYRAPRKPLTGSVEEIAAGLRAFARAGVEHVQLWLAPSTMAGIDAFRPVLEQLDRG